MLVLHLRTVAFISSLSTAIQSIIWIIAYILYVLAYDCSYSFTKFTSNSTLSTNLPLDLGPYFVWYFQGSNCVTSTAWINHARGVGANVLLDLFSVGIVLNIIFLGLSIYTLIGLYTNLELYRRLLSYSISIYIISIWDIVLLAVVVKDFSPLLDIKHYKLIDKENNPGDLAFPFFTNVLVIVILLVSRFIVVWIFNVYNATILIIKNGRVKNESRTSKLPEIIHPTELRDENKESAQRSNFDQDNKFWGLKANKDSPLSKWQIPENPPDNEPDELSRRWNMSRGRSVDATPPVTNLSRIEEDESRPNRMVDTNLVNGIKNNEEIWKDMENHIKESDNKWRSNEFAFNPNFRRNESMRQSQNFRSSLTRNEPSRQSQMRISNFNAPVRESLRRGRTEFVPQENLPEEVIAPQKPPEGFRYMNEVDKKMDASEMFGIKLRHVQRPSIPNEQSSASESEVPSNEATPYAITSITDIEPLNESFNPRFFPTESKSTSANSNSDSGSILQRKGLGAPPAPPLDAPPAEQSKDSIALRAQMSLEEAIRTRRPLKPVNRPAIDTSC